MSKIIIALYILITSSALIVLKLGARDGSPIHFLSTRAHVNITPLTILGVGLYGLSFFIYVYLISRYDLGYIIPLTAAFVYVLIFVASYFIFKEVFTPLKILGIFLIVCGLIFLNIKK